MSIYDAMKYNNSMNIDLLDKDDKRRLVVSYPELIEEWDYSKNKEDINKMYVSSNRKVWWKCKECGHEWKAYIGNRTIRKSGCPKCREGNNKSLMEYAIYLIIKEKFNDAISGLKLNNMSFDIGIPELKVIIEYQGRYYHSNEYNDYDTENNDKKKREYVEKLKDIKYITINETYGGTKLKVENNNIYFNADNINNHKYDCICAIINGLEQILNIELNVREDIETYTVSQMQLKDINESLGTNYKELAEEWHTEKNGHLTPFKVKPQSNKTVWWKCRNCGNEYTDKIVYMVNRHHCCPLCRIMAPCKDNIIDVYDF